MVTLIKKLFRPLSGRFSGWFFKIYYTYPVWLLVNRHDRTEKKNGELQDHGIMITDIWSLADKEDGDRILAAMQQHVKERIEHAPVAIRSTKQFLRYLWPAIPEYDSTNPFHAFAMHPKVKAIADGYFGLKTQLYYLTLNVTLPVGEDAEAQASQRWHRDHEDKRLLKMFIYVNDVDSEAGPFLYAKDSAWPRRYSSFYPQKIPFGVYPPPRGSGVRTSS